MKKSELQKALEIVKPALSSRELIEQSTCFAFIDGMIVTYNDEISISHPVEGLEISGAIHAESLYQVLKKLKSDEIEFELSENEVMLISGKSRVGLKLESEIKLPLNEISGKKKWKKLPDEFTNALKLTIPSASKNMSTAILTCVHVHESGFMEASDQLRITRYNIPAIGVSTFLLPASSANTALKLKPIKIAEGNGWVHFKNEEGTVISCRIFDNDVFPQTEALLQVKGSQLSFPEKIKDLVDCASVFSKNEVSVEDVIEVSVNSKKITISSQSEHGWYRESVKSLYEGDEISFFIHPNLLKDILKEKNECVVSENKIKFSGDNWCYVAVLQTKQ